MAILSQARTCWQFEVLLKKYRNERHTESAAAPPPIWSSVSFFFMKNITREKIACSSQVKFVVQREMEHVCKRLMCPVIACHCVLMQIHSHLKNRHEWLLVGCIPPPRLTIPLLYLLMDTSHLNTPDYFLRN